MSVGGAEGTSWESEGFECLGPRTRPGYALPPATPPLACQHPLEIVSLEGRPCLLVSTSSRGQAWLPPQSGRPWLSLLSVCCLHPEHYFIFVLFFFPANILAFPKTPGFIIFLAFPGSWESEYKATIIASSISLLLTPHPLLPPQPPPPGSHPVTPS